MGTLLFLLLLVLVKVTKPFCTFCRVRFSASDHLAPVAKQMLVIKYRWVQLDALQAFNNSSICGKVKKVAVLSGTFRLSIFESGFS